MMVSNQRVNILMVDDQPGKLLSYEAILKDMDQNLIKANSAREALEQLLKHDIAVVLIDVCMPELDGFELASMIREHPRCGKTAIILVSAILMTDIDRIRGYGTGAVDYVSVPIVPEVLRAKVNVFVDLYRKSVQLAELNHELEMRVAERTSDLEATNSRLRESEMRFRLATEAMSGGVYDWDLSSTKVERSSGLIAILGYTPEVAEPSLAWWTAHVHPDDDLNRRERVLAVLQSDARTYAVEYRMRHHDGRWIWVWDRGRVVRAEDGLALRVVGHTTDITAQREADEQLKEADRRKDAFLATLAHELRNPLAPIRNSIAVMRNGNASEHELTWCHEVIERQVSHLTRLVDDLLDLSRITRDKIELRTAEIELGEVIEAAEEACRPLIQQGGLELQIAHLAHPVRLRADRIRLTQCLVNLLNNAVKFTPRGGRICLEVELVHGDIPELLLRLTDSGIGIEPEKLPHLFDLFYQGETTSERSQGGLGIGLTLVRRLIELHGGSIDARSEGLGRGAEFLIRLPILTESNPTVAAPANGKVSVSPLTTRRRILVADDSKDVAQSLAIFLKHAHCEVRVANDGVEALAVAAEFQPEVALLDIGMPRMTGYEVASAIRRAEWGKDIYLIALTGWGQEEDRQRTFGAGFDLHLVKPVDPGALLRILLQPPPALKRNVEATA